MCGILAIVNTKQSPVRATQLAQACRVIRHRGPDDEGFLTWSPGEQPIVWAGEDTAATTLHHWKYESLPQDKPFTVGFGHRRLSIIDLSPAGHQPMLYEDAGLSISFNGEIYNYIEVREELQQLGRTFCTHSDTEVILQAWAQWGTECMHKFNGMFAFILLDQNKQQLYAVRDRFGVKPLFYYSNEHTLYLASEIKQIRTAPGYQFRINEPLLRQFLATGAVNHTYGTFDTQVQSLPPGHYLQADVSGGGLKFEVKQWYKLQPKQWTGTYEQAAQELKNILTDAVHLRLRSDVKVGSALSGGLDSSSIVCIVAKLLQQQGAHAGQETVTACYESARFDEWNFAQEVIKTTNAKPHRTFPSFKQLQQEVDAFLWHQDDPTGSTSQFSQWAVFKASREAGLTVMIDGQGADEQFAGYSGNDLPLYINMIRKMQVGALISEAKAYKKEKGAWPKGFLVSGLRHVLGKSQPKYTTPWMKTADSRNIYEAPADSVHENLLRQFYHEPLPALLRYEDHNSMAWSVESRTPFMDYRLVEFSFGLPDRFLYRNHVRKSILRDAMHNVLPPAIENRKDKMGFVTPEELWLRGEGKEWFIDGVNRACELFPNIIDGPKAKQYVNDMIAGKVPFTFEPWRMLCLARWYDMMSKHQ